MGLFSSLFEIGHRAVGMRAMEFCTTSSIEQFELDAKRRFDLEKSDLITARNSLYTMLLNAFFNYAHERNKDNPNATFEIAKISFQGYLYDHCQSIREPERDLLTDAVYTYINPDESASWLYQKLKNDDLSELDGETRLQFENFVVKYVDRTAAFFKKQSPKLLR